MRQLEVFGAAANRQGGRNGLPTRFGLAKAFDSLTTLEEINKLTFV